MLARAGPREDGLSVPGLAAFLTTCWTMPTIPTYRAREWEARVKRISRCLCAMGLVGVWLLPGVAMADIGRLPNGADYNFKILVVTSDKIGSDTVCEVDSDLYNVVVIDTGPAIMTVLAVPAGADVAPGDRYDLISQIGCDFTHDFLQMTPIWRPYR